MFGKRMARLGGIGVLALAVGVGLTACGDDADDSDDSSDAMTAYVSCLREQGIDLPDDYMQGSGQGPGQGEGQPGEMPSGGPGSGQGQPGEMPSGGPGGGASGAPGGGPGGGQGMQAPDGVDADDWTAAQEACQDQLPQRGEGQPGTRPSSDTLAAYRNCLAEHDVTMTGSPDDLDETDSTVKAAMDACEALAPS